MVDVSTQTQFVTVSVEQQKVFVSSTESLADVLVSEQAVSVSANENVVNVSVVGKRGRNGVDSTIPVWEFSYGDAGQAIFTAPANGVLSYSRVQMLVAFDGIGAQLHLGTLASPDAALSASDPSQLSEFEDTPDLELLEGEAIRLVIDPGSGASQGAGRVYLVFNPKA